MKIKLNRALWNHQENDEFEIEESRGRWAVLNGHAVEVIEPVDEAKPTTAQNKAIEPKYEQNVTFAISGEKLKGVLTKPQKRGRK